jgi:hypothetical protein
MAGILDMLSAPANPGNGTNFPFAQQASPFAALLQGLGIKSASPYGVDDANAFLSSPYAPSAEQAQRQAQLAALFPQSRNVVDRRGALESFPQQLPLQQVGQSLWQGLMQRYPTWPMVGAPVLR